MAVFFQAQVAFQYQDLLTEQCLSIAERGTVTLSLGRRWVREFPLRYPPKGVVEKAQHFESNDTGLNHS